MTSLSRWRHGFVRGAGDQQVSLPSASYTAAMTDPGPKLKLFKWLKLIISSLVVTVLLLFTVASIRTITLDVNVGLQLANWEETKNISLAIDHHHREELLANFKGKWVIIKSKHIANHPTQLDLTLRITDCVTSPHVSRGYPDPHGVVLGDGEQHHCAAGV